MPVSLETERAMLMMSSRDFINGFYQPTSRALRQVHRFLALFLATFAPSG